MLANGTLLQNRYLIKRPLAQGGMGTVYEAEAIHLGHAQVAVKETFFAQEWLREQFQREAAMLARLRHDALPRVSDHFVEGAGQFLVMEFIPGEDIDRLLNEKLKADGKPFGWRQVVQWADRLLDALEYIHGQHPPIIHRDIKPQNLKLTPRGDLFLIDFGLAKDATTPTRPGRSLHAYTLNYAPPEQMKGTGTDARSDLYSLGATLHHLLSGEMPDNAKVREEVVRYRVPDPLPSVHELNPQVPKAVADVLLQSLALDREERFQSAAAMRQALRQAWQTAEAELAESGETAPLREEELRQRQLEEERRRQELAERAEAERQEAERRKLEEEERQRQEEARQQELEGERRRQEELAERERIKLEEAERLRLEETERRQQEEEQKRQQQAAAELEQRRAEQRKREEERRLLAEQRRQEEERRHKEARQRELERQRKQAEERRLQELQHRQTIEKQRQEEARLAEQKRLQQERLEQERQEKERDEPRRREEERQRQELAEQEFERKRKKEIERRTRPEAVTKVQSTRTSPKFKLSGKSPAPPVLPSLEALPEPPIIEASAVEPAPEVPVTAPLPELAGKPRMASLRTRRAQASVGAVAVAMALLIFWQWPKRETETVAPSLSLSLASPQPAATALPAAKSVEKIQYWFELFQGDQRSLLTRHELAAKQKFKLHFKSSEDGYLYLLALGERNQLSLVTNSRIQSGADFAYPPRGQERIEGLENGEQLRVTVLSSRNPIGNFNSLLRQTNAAASQTEAIEMLRAMVGAATPISTEDLSGRGTPAVAVTVNAEEKPLIFDIVLTFRSN